MMDNQQKIETYIMVDSLVRIADKLELSNPGDSVSLRQAAEWIERTIIPIAERR